MNDPLRLANLNDVLDAYMAATQNPSREILTEWIRKYPQYEKELTDFTVVWIQMESFPPAEREELDEDILVLRGMSVVQNLLHKIKARPTVEQQPRYSIESLIAEGRSQGLQPAQIADLLKLSVALLRKLDRRLILFISIPLELIEAIASSINREILSVAEYLQGEPILPKKAHYKAEQTPFVSEQRDFFDEVRSDQEISEEHRDRWLEMEPKVR